MDADFGPRRRRGGKYQIKSADDAPVKPALDLAFAPRGSVELAKAVTHDVPELDLRVLEGALTMTPANAPATGPGKKKTGCGCGTSDASTGLALAGLLLLLRRRRR